MKNSNAMLLSLCGAMTKDAPTDIQKSIAPLLKRAVGFVLPDYSPVGHYHFLMGGKREDYRAHVASDAAVIKNRLKFSLKSF